MARISQTNEEPTSRREFLRRSAAAAATATVAKTVAAPQVIANDRVQGANERIGEGFIGVGGRRQAHLAIIKEFQEQGLAAPAAVCDVYRPRGARAGSALDGSPLPS